MESFAICGLLRDVCKAQFYKVSSRNVKNPEPDAGKPSHFTRLKTSFHTAWRKIRVFDRAFSAPETFRGGSHPLAYGGFDEAARGGSFAISHAYEKYPLAVKLHLADLQSTYLKERAHPRWEEDKFPLLN